MDLDVDLDVVVVVDELASALPDSDWTLTNTFRVATRGDHKRRPSNQCEAAVSRGLTFKRKTSAILRDVWIPL